MKRKIISVLLCVALLLTLSINVSADATGNATQPITDKQTTPVTDEITVTVNENGAEIIENENLGNNTAVPLSQNAGIISGGVYRLKNVASGKYMNVDYGIDANGTNIYQWTGDGSTEQKFKVVYSSSTDSYMLYAMCSSNGTNRVVDVTRGGTPLTSGQNIKLYNPTDPTSQEIKIVSLGSNKYKLVMRANQNMAITSYGTANGSASGTTATSTGNIFISTYTGSTNQQWQFELLENPNPAPVGCLDTVSTTMIGGWAYQSNIPNTALTVHIYIINNSTGEQKIIGVTAGGYRADLAAAGYGNGYHAFQYNVSWKTYKPGTYTVRAYAIGVNSSNPQLDYSPKSYTVRNPAGNIEYVDRRGIGGWAWKPDAPNSAIDVHIYIYKSDNTQVAFYPVTASQPRSDLASAGYGNGNHGFSKTIDWSALPEERLRVVVYAVDGSGYNPSFYSGYYDNKKKISLLTMVDGEGYNRSAWAQQSIVNTYCQNLGCSSIIKSSTANDNYYTNAIDSSMYCVISTHGNKSGIEWSMRNVYSGHVNCTSSCTTCFGMYNTTDLNALSSDYFQGTRCVVLMACSTAEGGETDATNFANVLHRKGVATVVGFQEKIWTYYITTSEAAVNLGSQLWITQFTKFLNEGYTVKTSAQKATVETSKEQKEYEEMYNVVDEIDDNCGLDSYCVIGDEDQVLKY